MENTSRNNIRMPKITIVAINVMLKENGLPQRVEDRKDSDYLVRKVGGKTLYEGRIVRCQMGNAQADETKGEKPLFVLNKDEREPKGELEPYEILIGGRVRIVEYTIIYLPLSNEEKARLENGEFENKKID